jgi:superfamily I DNA/RNA helicase
MPCAGHPRSAPQLGAVRRIEEFCAVLDTITAAAEESVGEAVRSVIEDTGYVTALEAERTIEALGRAENLRELASVAVEFEAQNEGSVIDGEPWESIPPVATSRASSSSRPPWSATPTTSTRGRVRSP